MHPDEPLYRKAFRDYLRHGTPPTLTLKQSSPTTHYVWRTKQDLLVRGSHAANDGKLFAWTARPATGHPGEDFGCRCVAEPFVPGVTEYVEIRLSGVNDTGPEWSTGDFIHHYYYGNGRGVILRQIGHLEKVVDRYMRMVRERLKGQIADEARKNPVGFFRYPFGRPYSMGVLVFSLGHTTIEGAFTGKSTLKNDRLLITGELDFYQRDEFSDPFDVGIEPPGTQIYSITDRWHGSLSGEVLKDRSRSKYIKR